MENNKLKYFEYNKGNWSKLIKVILEEKSGKVVGIKKVNTTKFSEEVDEFGNNKTNKYEDTIDLTEEQITKLYDFIIDNINLFESLAKKNIPENGLDTGTISNINIKYDNIELNINCAISGKTDEEQDILNQLYILSTIDSDK